MSSEITIPKVNKEFREPVNGALLKELKGFLSYGKGKVLSKVAGVPYERIRQLKRDGKATPTIEKKLKDALDIIKAASADKEA